MDTALSKEQLLNKLDALQKRIDTLEQQVQDHQKIQEALHQAERRYGSLTENIPDVVYSLDAEGTILTINKAATTYGYSPAELIGRSFIELIYHKDRDRVVNSYFEVVAQKKDYARAQRFRITTKTGELRWVEANCAIRFTPDGQFILQEGVCRDITESIHNQDNLIATQEALEEQVQIRTKELRKANAELQKEIAERREAEKGLREREAELELEKTNLEEANTALKVLLKRREVDKRELEEQVLYNIKELVLPYMDKLKQVTGDRRQSAYISILESNLSDLTCAFSRRLSLEFYGLTTSELKVANFIRQGKKSHEISSMLGLSIRTVEAYRQSIRRKLRLQNKKVNLRTFLMSIN